MNILVWILSLSVVLASASNSVSLSSDEFASIEEFSSSESESISFLNMPSDVIKLICFELDGSSYFSFLLTCTQIQRIANMNTEEDFSVTKEWLGFRRIKITCGLFKRGLSSNIFKNEFVQEIEAQSFFDFWSIHKVEPWLPSEIYIVHLSFLRKTDTIEGSKGILGVHTLPDIDTLILDGAHPVEICLIKEYLASGKKVRKLVVTAEALIDIYLCFSQEIDPLLPHLKKTVQILEFQLDNSFAIEILGTISDHFIDSNVLEKVIYGTQSQSFIPNFSKFFESLPRNPNITCFEFDFPLKFVYKCNPTLGNFWEFVNDAIQEGSQYIPEPFLCFMQQSSDRNVLQLEVNNVTVNSLFDSLRVLRIKISSDSVLDLDALRGFLQESQALTTLIVDVSETSVPGNVSMDSFSEFFWEVLAESNTVTVQVVRQSFRTAFRRSVQNLVSKCYDSSGVLSSIPWR